MNLKEMHEEHIHHAHEGYGDMKNWRAWGSWFSWGSPIGLSVWFVSAAVSLGVILLSVAEFLKMIHVIS